LHNSYTANILVLTSAKGGRENQAKACKMDIDSAF